MVRGSRRAIAVMAALLVSAGFGAGDRGAVITAANIFPIPSNTVGSGNGLLCTVDGLIGCRCRDRPGSLRAGQV